MRGCLESLELGNTSDYCTTCFMYPLLRSLSLHGLKPHSVPPAAGARVHRSSGCVRPLSVHRAQSLVTESALAGRRQRDSSSSSFCHKPYWVSSLSSGTTISGTKLLPTTPFLIRRYDITVSVQPPHSFDLPFSWILSRRCKSPRLNACGSDESDRMR